MKKEILVSVIIPAYNSEKYLGACLESILNQDFKDFEVIVVDNNSSDGTKEIILELAKKHKNLKYFFEPKIGRGAARNTGEKQAVGKVILMTDSDCVVPKGWIKAMVEPILSGSAPTVQGGEIALGQDFWSRQEDLRASERFEAFKKGKRLITIDTKNFAIARELLEKIGFSDRDLKRGNDTDLTIRLLKREIVSMLRPDIKVGHAHRDSLLEVARKQFWGGFWCYKISVRHHFFLRQTSFLRETEQARKPILESGRNLKAVIFGKGLSYLFFDLVTGISWRAGLFCSKISNLSGLSLDKDGLPNDKDSRRNILFITHCISMYGANRSLIGLIDGLKQYGINFSVVCPAVGPITDELKKRNIKYYVLPVKYWISENPKKRFYRLAMNLISSVMISFVAIKENARIIYSNSSATPAGSFSAFLLNRPHIWHIREFSGIGYDLRHDFGANFFKYWLRKAAAIICVSNVVREKIVADLGERAHVIYNGIIREADFQRINEQRAKFFPKSEYTFINIGILSENKNQENAVRAFNLIKDKYPRIRLLLVGDYKTEYGEKLRRLCTELNLSSRVLFEGYLHDPFEKLSSSDLLLMCSKKEGLGRVTLEAMLHGKPVIGLASTGTKEIIDHGKNGLLYDGSYLELAKLMEKFIADQEWGYSLGQNGIEKIRERFLIEHYAKQVLDILNHYWG